MCIKKREIENFCSTTFDRTRNPKKQQDFKGLQLINN